MRSLDAARRLSTMAAWIVATLVLVAALTVVARPALAQTTYGTLSNFDAFNDTGQEVHGFEIELDGISSANVTYTFGGTYIRYGDPRVVDFPGGVSVRYESPWDAVNKVFTQTTPLAPSVITPTDGHACWTGGSATYGTSGCEHFGVGLTANPTATVYRWLVADPANPGQLIALGTKVSIPAPVWNVAPPPVPGGAPVVQAVLPAEPPEAGQEYGNAMWVKVFVTESPNRAELNHLVTDDPAVPQEAVETEVEWTILQAGPAGGNNELVNEGAVGAGAESVTRRYEFYEYTGAYDPESHEALCADGSCNQPMPGELGNYIGAQMAALNLAAPAALTLAAAMPGGEVGLPFSASLVSGGTPPYTIQVLKGALPSGLVSNPIDGTLSGTPTAVRNIKVTIEVMDQDGASVQGPLTFKIVKAIGITTKSLKARAARNYRAVLKAAGGRGPYVWALVGGSLPAGLLLDGAAGVLSGVPTTAGIYDLTFEAMDSLGGRDQQNVRLTVTN